MSNQVSVLVLTRLVRQSPSYFIVYTSYTLLNTTSAASCMCQLSLVLNTIMAITRQRHGWTNGILHQWTLLIHNLSFYSEYCIRFSWGISRISQGVKPNKHQPFVYLMHRVTIAYCRASNNAAPKYNALSPMMRFLGLFFNTIPTGYFEVV